MNHSTDRAVFGWGLAAIAGLAVSTGIAAEPLTPVVPHECELAERLRLGVESSLFSMMPADDAAVIAVPSEQWGETPLGLVVLRQGAAGDLEAIRDWANQQLGKGQRLSALERRDDLPRSTIGKILKRELRDPYWKDLEQSKRD